MSILNKTISYYPSITASTRGREVNLLQLLQSNKHKERILSLRASEKEIQKKLKQSLPCYTPAGRFNRRCEEGLIELSGLAAVDLDSAEQYDQMYILKHLRKDIPCIAHAGFSCRGERLYCLVVFKFPDQYQRQYARLIRSFEAYNLPMGDQCHKSISQPRFVTWNDNDHQFFVHDAEPYALSEAQKRFYHIRIAEIPVAPSSETPENIFSWCLEQYNKSHSFCEPNRHKYIFGLARYCNKKGVPQQVTLNGCLSFVQKDFSAYEIEEMVTHIYTKHADSHNTIPFTVRKRGSIVNRTVKPSKDMEVEDSKGSDVKVASIEPQPIKTASEKWDHQISELESFFASIELPSASLQLNAWTIITNVAQFVQSHLSIVKTYSGVATFEPFLLRLHELKNVFLRNSISNNLHPQ